MTSTLDDAPVLRPVRPTTREPRAFDVTMLDLDQPEGEDEVTQTFYAKTDRSFGTLLSDLSGKDNVDGLLAYFRGILVTDNTDPDTRGTYSTEWDRFYAHLTNPDLFIDETTLSRIAERVDELTADRPTSRPSASRATRRAATRGSAGKPPRRT